MCHNTYVFKCIFLAFTGATVFERKLPEKTCSGIRAEMAFLRVFSWPGILMETPDPILQTESAGREQERLSYSIHKAG
jgi:hypothetical protein